MPERISVLYVDDESILLELGKRFLEEDCELVVDTAESASDGLSILSGKAYDAIVSDYQMPEMNGIEFLKRVRSENKSVPFIIFTGRSREEVVIAALNNGADFYLQRGGDPRPLFAELTHVIRQVVLMRRTQLTLAEQEQRYHDLRNANDLIQSVKPDGHFLFVNKKWLDTLGYQESELSDLTIFDIIHEASLAHCMDLFKRVLAGENVGIIDAVFRTREGKRVWVEGIASCKIADGQPQYTRGIFKDVTDRRLADAALKESEETFRAMVEQSGEGIVIVDFSGMLLFANGRAWDIVDYPAAMRKTGNVNVLDLISPDMRAEAIRDFLRVSGGTDSYPVTYKITTFDKSERWLECIGKKISFKCSPAMLLSFRDTTERTKAEDILRESENKFSTVFRHNPVSLTLVSATDGIFLDVNEAFVRNTGYSREEVIGKTSGELGIFADADEYARMVSGLRERSHLEGMEVSCRIKSGELRTCLFSSATIMMGKNPYILSVVEDITERRATETAFQAMVTSMVGTTGMEALDRIAETISAWLEADCVMIGEITPDHERVNVLSMLLDGKKIRDYSYTLKGTPCENTAEKGFCTFPDEVGTMFPDSRDLSKFNIRGYAGTPLRNFEGKVVGILCILSRKPLRLPPSAREIIDIIAVKAAAEIGLRTAMEAIRESEKKFRSIFENSPYPISINSIPDGRFIAVNESFLVSSGYKEAEIIGKTPMDLGLLSIADFARFTARMVLAGRLENVSMALKGKGGRWVHVLFSTIPVSIGDHPAIVTMTVETTNLKRVEKELVQKNEELQASEENFRRIFENNSLGMALVMPDLRFLLVNPAMVTMTGYPEEEFRNMSFQGIIHPDDIAEAIEGIRALEAGTVPVYHAEKRQVRKDGSILWGALKITAVRNQDGTLRSYLAQIEDITRKKLENEALRESEERMALVMNGVPTLISFMDPGLRFVYMNKAHAEWYGQTEQDLIGKSLEDLLPGDIFQRALPFFRQVLTGREVRFENPTRDRSGHERIMSIHLVPHMRGDAVLGFFAVLDDVTERRKAENALQRANRQLNLLSSITRHDILNQLLVLKGYLDLARDAVADPVAFGLIEKSDTVAQTIEHQIMFTSDYQELGAAAPVWQNVNDNIQRAVAQLPMQDIRVEVGFTDLEIFADSLFEKVFYNLIDNALRYGGERMTTIRMTAKEAGPELTIVCEDDGAGISEENKTYLFTRNFGKNTGLGLFLSREILSITSITITENGTPGRGARFEITAPDGGYRFTG